MGECSIDTTLSETSNLYCRFDGVTEIPSINSNVVTVEIEFPLFYDDCTTNRLNEYTLNYILNSRTPTATYTGSAYTITEQGIGMGALVIPLNQSTNYHLTADLKINSTSGNVQCGFGLWKPNNNGRVIRIGRDVKFGYFDIVNNSEGSGTHQISSQSHQTSKYYQIEMIVTENNARYIVSLDSTTIIDYNQDCTGYLTNSKPCLFTGYDNGNNCSVKNIKVTSI